MDTQQLVSEAKIRFKHQESKLYLEEKYNGLLIFANQGGSWKATPELISFLKNSPSSVILLDNFKNPIKIETVALLEEMEDVYQAVMQEWYKEHSKLQGYR